MIQTKS